MYRFILFILLSGSGVAKICGALGEVGGPGPHVSKFFTIFPISVGALSGSP